MKKVLLPFLVFFFFVFEGTVMQVFSPERFGFDTVLIPRFVLLVILFIAIYISVSRAMVYSLFSGLLYDIVYTDLLGVYMFSMAIAIYIIALCAKVIHANLIVGLLFALLAQTILEFLVFGLYTLVGIVHMPIEIFFFERLFPSFVLNGVFFIIFYYPMRKLIDETKELES